MNKKKRQLYISISFFLIMAIIAVIWAVVMYVISPYLNWGAIGVGIFGAVCGSIGVGGLLSPEKIGKFAVKLFGNLIKNSMEPQSTGNQQSQTKSSGNQLNIHGSKNIIHVDSDKTEWNTQESHKQFIGSGKVFGCSSGHGCRVFPPDDIHPLASCQEDVALQNASGTVVPMVVTCEKCGDKFTLYWYKQAIQVSHGKSLF